MTWLAGVGIDLQQSQKAFSDWLVDCLAKFTGPLLADKGLALKGRSLQFQLADKGMAVKDVYSVLTLNPLSSSCHSVLQLTVYWVCHTKKEGGVDWVIIA